ncbi:MAG: hypothetical protein P4L84_33890 [Isosphaeraceae bacterium]|nr:hypothetical protein [Isosphaeraceae bacterium]
MDVSSGLSDLWELFGELFEDITQAFQKLSVLIQKNPQFWTWLTVWLGVVWICMRWTKLVAEANERRIFAAAESRLSILIRDASGVSAPTEAAAAPPDHILEGQSGPDEGCLETPESPATSV